MKWCHLLLVKVCNSETQQMLQQLTTYHANRKGETTKSPPAAPRMCFTYMQNQVSLQSEAWGWEEALARRVWSPDGVLCPLKASCRFQRAYCRVSAIKEWIKAPPGPQRGDKQQFIRCLMPFKLTQIFSAPGHRPQCLQGNLIEPETRDHLAWGYKLSKSNITTEMSQIMCP